MAREAGQERIMRALAAACAEKGYGSVTIADVAMVAGVSNHVVYEQFPNKGAIAVALLEAAQAELFAEVEGACCGRHGLTAIDEGLGAVLAWVEQDATVARACFVERYEFERAEVLQSAPPDRFAELLRARAPADPQRPPWIEEMVVGGVEALLKYRLIAGQGDSATAARPEMRAFVLGPYERRW